MHRFIARQNIEHYSAQLKIETDPAKREMLLKLLAEEEAKQALNSDHKHGPTK